ncbi:hypothetical protein ACGFX4_39730 [Kitasatospora sp. NPDC048365]|uniref:hypothetical protein n=1 Tax=Kitasatospora sp. NPDC048365 TaxID=3364050 RepID=UPI00371510D8
MAAHALRAEWLKTTTLRSAWTVPLAGVLLSVPVSAVTCALIGDKQQLLIDDPSVAIHYGLWFGQLFFAVAAIGVLGREYSSGTIGASLTAVPRRGRLYGAKLALAGGLGLAAGTATSVGSFLAATVLDGTPVRWDDPDAVRSVVAAALYPALLAVLCVGLTAALRNATAATGFVLLWLCIGSSLFAAVPGLRELLPYLPDRAGQYAIRYQYAPHFAYPHWVGTAVLALWAAGAALLGLRRFRRAAH